MQTGQVSFTFLMNELLLWLNGENAELVEKLALLQLIEALLLVLIPVPKSLIPRSLPELLLRTVEGILWGNGAFHLVDLVLNSQFDAAWAEAVATPELMLLTALVPLNTAQTYLQRNLLQCIVA